MRNVIAGLLVVAFCLPANAGNCHVLYRQRQAVVVNHAYAQQFVAPIVYQVGRDIQDDAVAEKIAQRVAAKLQAIQAVQKQSVGNAIKSATGSVLAAKCVRCHNKSKRSGDVVFDGSEPVSAEAQLATIAMLGLKEGIPDPMTSVMAGLTKEEISQLTEEVLRFNSTVAQSSNSEAGVLK